MVQVLQNNQGIKEEEYVNLKNIMESIKAIRLRNLPDGSCVFDVGYLEDGKQIPVTSFFGKSTVKSPFYDLHPAPRRQYVVTLKGKLKFTVTDGSSFILEPGIVLLAEDVDGPGHSWELLEGNTWERLYLVAQSDIDNYFITETV